MASDISKIIKEELSNTLEQLLSTKAKVEEVIETTLVSEDNHKCVEVSVNFKFGNIVSSWSIILPKEEAIKFEYLMLGGMGDTKEELDEEISDAMKEIISNVCGSISTSINAQSFYDIQGIKSEILSSNIVETKNYMDNEALYKFSLSLSEEAFSVFIKFDSVILSYISSLARVQDDEFMSSIDSPVSSSNEKKSNVSSLSDNTSKNLDLLLSIKLKLSVRLGTKIFLLKDILKWDIGEIIELEQMVDEPLDILINGIKIGNGEAVIVEGKFGLKIKNIGSEALRLNKIGLG